MQESQQLANRYVAVWNEADVTHRRTAITELWTAAGEHYTKTREARGYDALEARITASHERNVRQNGHRFFAAQDACALHDAVIFHWTMRPADGDEVLATGLVVLILDPDGRIRIDYLFID